jgi:glycosyltransferase involved in cell wall biosynthesis
LVRATGGGLLCAKDDPAALAAALERVVTDPALRESLAAAGHEAVRRDYTADRMAGEFAAVCAAVIGGAS